MKGINKAILIGNLGKDPEIRYTGTGKAVANFSLATTEVRGSGADKTEYTEWHNIVAWDRLAEVCGEYLHKGASVYIEGSIRSRSYDDKQGNTKYITEIVANQMQILSSKRDADDLSSDADVPF